MTSEKQRSLDLDDIKGTKTRVTDGTDPSNILAAPKKKKPKTHQKTGINLTIKTLDGKFISRDLAECTAEEFLDWAKGVYPMVTAEPAMFESRVNRMRAFNQIQRYHISCLTEEQLASKN